MIQRRLLAALVVMTVTGCTPSANTGDVVANELVDLVVGKEAPFHQCIEIGPLTEVTEYSEGLDAPGLLHPEAFEDARISHAASGLAISGEKARARDVEAEVLIIGEPDAIDGTGSCSLRVRSPVFSQHFAFIEFSTPGGVIGAYAFERSEGSWRAAERIHLRNW